MAGFSRPLIITGSEMLVHPQLLAEDIFIGGNFLRLLGPSPPPVPRRSFPSSSSSWGCPCTNVVLGSSGTVVVEEPVIPSCFIGTSLGMESGCSPSRCRNRGEGYRSFGLAFWSFRWTSGLPNFHALHVFEVVLHPLGS
jgi:hypothetical protein